MICSSMKDSGLISSGEALQQKVLDDKVDDAIANHISKEGTNMPKEQVLTPLQDKADVSQNINHNVVDLDFGRQTEYHSL
jgi:hypothetical protein